MTITEYRKFFHQSHKILESPKRDTMYLKNHMYPYTVLIKLGLGPPSTMAILILY
jgi:hypothetical protein